MLIALIKCHAGGTQDASPLESWGMIKGRFGQPGADGVVFCVIFWSLSTMKI